MSRIIPRKDKFLVLLTLFALSTALATAHERPHKNVDNETIMENHGIFIEYYDTSGDNMMNFSEVNGIIAAWNTGESPKLNGETLERADVNASIALYNREYRWKDPRESDKIFENYKDVLTEFDMDENNMVDNKDINALVEAYHKDETINGEELDKRDIEAAETLLKREYEWQDYRTLKPDMGETFKVEEGDIVKFGPENGNKFTVTDIYQLKNKNLDFDPNVPVPGSRDGIAGIVGDSSTDLEFKTGYYRIYAESYQVEDNKATMRIEKVYLSTLGYDTQRKVTRKTAQETCKELQSQSKENIYYFCGSGKNKTVDLGAAGPRKIQLGFNANLSSVGVVPEIEIHTPEGKEISLALNKRGKDWKGATFTPKGYTGLMKNHEQGSGFYQAKIKVEPKEVMPDGSISFEGTTYRKGQQATLNTDIAVKGDYRLEISGTGVDRKEKIQEKGVQKIKVQPKDTGTLNAKLIAPGTWWNPLDNTKVVDRDSVEVRGLPRKSYLKVERTVETGSISRDDYGYEITSHAKLAIYMDSKEIELPENYKDLYLSIDTEWFGNNADVWFSIKVQKNTSSGWGTVWSEGNVVGPSGAPEGSGIKKKVPVKEDVTYRVIADSGGKEPFGGGEMELDYPKFLAHQTKGSGKFTLLYDTFQKENKFLASGIRNTFSIRVYNNQIHRDKPEINYYIGENSPKHHLRDAFNPAIGPSSSRKYHARGSGDLEKLLKKIESGKKEIYVKLGSQKKEEAKKVGEVWAVKPEGAIITRKSVEGDIAPGSKFSLIAKGKVFGHGAPAIVVGSKDREEVYGVIRAITSSGEDFRTQNDENQQPVTLPESCEGEVVAVPITSQQEKERFKKGDGIATKLGSCSGTSDNSDYTPVSYTPGEPVTIEPGIVLEFNGNKLYVSSVGLSGNYMKWEAGSSRSRMNIASRIDADGGSTTHEFGGTKYAIGVCKAEENSAKIVALPEDSVMSSEKTWPGDYCKETQGDGQGTEEEEKKDGKAVTDIKIDKKSFNPGETAEIQVEMSESLASNGYTVRIEGPEGHTVKTVGGEVTEKTVSFQGDKAGSYTAYLEPSGMIGKLKGVLTGTRYYDTAKFSYKGSSVAWKNFCIRKDYNIESIQQQINCIKQEIVPAYFQDSVGENPQVAESLCSDLLNYKYSQEETRCVK